MPETNRKPVEFVLGAQDAQALAAFSRVTAKLEGMMAPIRRVQDALNRPLNQAGLGQFTNQLGTLRAAMSAVPVAGTLFATGGITAATAALIRNSTAAVNAVSKIQDLSDSYKISTDDLQVFSEIGADSGVAMEEIAKSMGFFQQKIAGARSGESGDIEFMAKIGVDSKTLKKDLPGIMARVADVFKNSTKDVDEALKVDLAKGGFGKSGAQMIAILEKGGGEVKRIYDLMKAEGRIFSSDQISSVDAIGDAWGATVRRFDHFKKTIGLSMTPMLKSISDAFDKFMASDSKPKMIETFKQIGESIGDTIPRLAGDLPDIVSGLAGIFRWVDKIGKVAGWDRVIAALGFMVASPFLASVFVLGKALAVFAFGAGKLFLSLGVMAYGALTGFAVAAYSMAASLVAIGVPAIAIVATLATLAAAVAGVAYLIYANWGGLKVFAEQTWSGFIEAMQPVEQAFRPVINIVEGAFTSLSKALGFSTDAIKDSESGFGRWAEAGRLAGETIASVMKVALTPVTALIDALKLLGSSWDFIAGRGFNFNSSLGALWQAPANETSAEARRLGSESPTIKSSRQDFSGRIDLDVTDNRIMVRRIDSQGGLDLTASAGRMYGAAQ